jgi:hypothetical protein
MAAISLDFSATFSWAKTRLDSVPNALTLWIAAADALVSAPLHNALPSMAMTSAGTV